MKALNPNSKKFGISLSEGQSYTVLLGISFSFGAGLDILGCHFCYKNIARYYYLPLFTQHMLSLSLFLLPISTSSQNIYMFKVFCNMREQLF